MRRALLPRILSAGGLLLALAPALALAQGTSLRFVNDRNAIAALIQRVRLVIGTYSNAVDLHPTMDLGDPMVTPFGSFTIELWMRGVGTENNVGETGCGFSPNSWINCAILVDRDFMGNPSFGDFGMSICNDGAVRVGLETQLNGAGICDPAAAVLDGAWHHLAITRDGQTGELCIFVDGLQGDCAIGPPGIASFDDRVGVVSMTGQDPTLVIGAEKHGFGLPYPGFRGWVDEARFSGVVRYATCGDGNLCFARPTAAFATDASTLALWHFDERPAGEPCSCGGSLFPLVQGTCVTDASGLGVNAECRYGNTAGRYGPQYSAFTPFGPFDSDGDGDPNAADNCPFAVDPNQIDNAGYGAGSPPDGTGSACQCGDADDNGAADPALDRPRVRRTLAGLTGGVVNLGKCSVAGTSGCDVLDAAVLARAAAGRPPGLAESCDAALP